MNHWYVSRFPPKFCIWQTTIKAVSGKTIINVAQILHHLLMVGKHPRPTNVPKFTEPDIQIMYSTCDRASIVFIWFRKVEGGERSPNNLFSFISST